MEKRGQWAGAGDVNAFFGLSLDNLAGLVLLVGLLDGVFQFPASFAVSHLVPGTALGVLLGDLMFTATAIVLARSTGRNNVTAMPLGLDTPSTFDMVFFVLGPAFTKAREAGMDVQPAAVHAWHLGMCAIVASGVFKLACSLVSGMVHRVLPRAGLLGSLAAIALVLISFLPLLDVMLYPAVGLVSLAVILTTLVARIELPWKIPGALAGVVAGIVVYHFMQATGTLGRAPEAVGELPSWGWLPPTPTLAWAAVWKESLDYLPVVLPLALATVVGGIDCTESAAAAGDRYHTGSVIAIEGLATLVAGCCGGVIQTTPYIGHPAYKAMGGRAGYTLATALFIGAAGMFGGFGTLYGLLPKAAVFPILIFVGIEITAQSFHATPVKHYPAVAMACVPALAYLALIFAEPLLTQSGLKIDDLHAPLADQIQTLRVLSGGFILTSLLWASGTAAIIDRRLLAAAAYFGTAGLFSLFGVIHSPLLGNKLVLPWALPDDLPQAAAGQDPFHLAAGYAAMAGLLFVWGMWRWKKAAVFVP